MGKFESNLWRRIVERHGAELASTMLPAYKLRRRALRLLARTGLALAGLGFALAVVLVPPAVSGRTPGGGGAGNSGTLASEAGNSGVGFSFGTSTGLSSSPNASLVGQQVRLTATVNPVPDGGTVRFTDPGTTITGCGAVPVNTTGQATCTTTFTVMGSHQVQAFYSGDASFTGSQSPVITQIVSRKTTSLHLSSSVNPVVVRRPVTYLAVVSPVPGGGGVTFLQDGRPIRGCVDVPVQRTSKVTCRWSYAFPRRRTIQARYTGTARFAKSTSNQLTETVKATHKHRH
ncbi:MAG TPA: Ig-like domain-containing protein [Solirubrobacteraceae bacterium]|jgi:hypothetical protein